MNLILSFLTENRERLNLGRYGVTGNLSSLMLTPTVYTSSHVEFLIMNDQSRAPVLAAKIPRTPENSAVLQREVDNLRLIQAMHREYTPRTPDVVTFETYRDVPILVQTVISGRAIGPAVQRGTLDNCWQRINRWLVELQQFQQIRRSVAEPEATGGERFQRLIEYPIRYFTKYFPVSEHEVQLLVRTWDIVESLRNVPLPVVFQHCNLGKQNVKLLNDGTVGVVNWELANPYGLPSCDLFRLLATSAISLDKAKSRTSYITAVHQAFFDRNGWARGYVHHYANILRLSNEVLTALFTLTWLQGTVNYLTRLEQMPPTDFSNLPHRQAHECSPEMAQWLRKRPDFVLWAYTVEQAQEIIW